MVKKYLLFLGLLVSSFQVSVAQTFNPSASSFPAGQLGEVYSEQVIVFTIPSEATLPGEVVEQVLSLAFPQAAPALGFLGLSSQTFDMNVTRATFNVTGLPQGLSGNCDATPCTYFVGTSGSITIAGTPSVAGNFTFDIKSFVEGDVDLSSIGGGVLSQLGIPSSFELPAPVPQALDENGYTVEVLNVNGIEEHNDLFSLSLFPNPTNDISVLMIETTERALAKIEVMDAIGSLVQQSSISVQVGNNSFPLQLNHLTSGLYMVKVEIGSQQALLRVQKN